MYKQTLNPFTNQVFNAVSRLTDNAYIPFAEENTDYQRFKTDVLEGAELQNADGNVMSADAAKEFIATLP